MKKINYDNYPFKNKVVDKLNEEPKKKKWSGRVESERTLQTSTRKRGNTNKRGTKQKSTIETSSKSKAKITNFTGENKNGYTLIDKRGNKKQKTKTKRTGSTKSKSKAKQNQTFSTYDKDNKLVSRYNKKTKTKTNKKGKTKTITKEKIYRGGKTKRYRYRS